MAGDWIKLRADISRDPRVIAIADALAESRPFMDWLTVPFGQAATCRESAYERVTRCVTVSVTVTALVRVWAVARAQGRTRGEDIFLDCATLPALDVIAEVPDFGYAMGAVGWVEELPAGGGLLFPKFLRQNTPPEDRRKEQAAARQQRKRERDKGVTGGRDGQRDKSVTCHADVTHRVEESREEKKTEKNPQPPAGATATIPPELDTPEFRKAWGEWKADRKARGIKPYTTRGEAGALKKLAPFGPAVAVAAIGESIAQSWQGLFPEKLTQSPARRGYQTQDEYVLGQIQDAIGGSP